MSQKLQRVLFIDMFVHDQVEEIKIYSNEGNGPLSLRGDKSKVGKIWYQYRLVWTKHGTKHLLGKGI